MEGAMRFLNEYYTERRKMFGRVFGEGHVSQGSSFRENASYLYTVRLLQAKLRRSVTRRSFHLHNWPLLWDDVCWRKRCRGRERALERDITFGSMDFLSFELARVRSGTKSHWSAGRTLYILFLSGKSNPGNAQIHMSAAVRIAAVAQPGRERVKSDFRETALLFFFFFNDFPFVAASENCRVVRCRSVGRRKQMH